MKHGKKERVAVEKARGPYHKFWIFQEGEGNYFDYWKLSKQKVPDQVISIDIIEYFFDTLKWIPSINPGNRGHSSYEGLNLYGPTIINKTGGKIFSDVFSSWGQLLSVGPKYITLTTLLTRVLEDEESKNWYRISIERTKLLQQLNHLAEMGNMTATGKYFILHLGV